jgi:hypothetical protein
MTFIEWVIVAAFALMIIGAIAFVWKNRPYRGPGADNAAADEMAMEASSFVNRSGRL